MQTIRAGDLYFLQSPFHTQPSDKGAQTEKRLSYLLGTVSSRPAVVIRPPTWWDRFNTVTVIPALSHGDPAIILHLTDRYGNMMKADYPFVPHNPHTIPVSRLGKYMGSLSNEELKEILYAYQWIHDPFMQMDTKTYPVPPVYENVMNKRIPPASWKANKDARSSVDIRIDPDMTLRSETHPEVNGFNVGPAIRTRISESAKKEFERDNIFVPTENPLADAECTETCVSVPVEKSFPPSIFDTETLNQVANRFTISDAYYNNDKQPRDPEVLTRAECSRIRDELSTDKFTEVIEYYKKMLPLDAYILGPRLPIDVLATITNFPQNQAVSLKRLCNYMRDIPDDIYLDRFTALEQQRAEKIEAEEKERSKAEQTPPVTNTPDDWADEVKKVKPYLNPKFIMTMDDDTAMIFLRIPTYLIKRNWKGNQCNTPYNKAVAHYKRKLGMAS